MNNPRKILSGARRKIIYSKYYSFADPFVKYPEKKFVIYTRGRTGSTVLTDLLNCHPEMFCDYEIFNISNTGTPIDNPYKYIKSCTKRATFNGKSVYGFKVKIEQLRDDHKYDDNEPIFQKLYEQGWKFIYLKRSNSLNHKISGIISNKTNVFHVKKEDDQHKDKIEIDCRLLLDVLIWGDKLDEMEEEKIKDIPHLKIIYEEDLLDNSKHQETANKVFKYLEISEQPVKTKLKKIIPLDLRDLIENYDEMVGFLKDTKFVKFLDAK